jgi:3-hydroxyisobutyrate dehydrogenase-like beta-hydroxyacid dehydrogenase
MSEPIGIIGLGRVGLPAAKAWLNDGHKVFGYDINPLAVDEFVAAGGIDLPAPADVARHAYSVIVMVLNDDQAMEVVKGKNGVVHGTHADTNIVCMSTINQRTVESLAALCQEKNIAFVDCPFTGGPARIASRDLTLIAAAPPEALQRVERILQAIGKITRVGTSPGQGQAVKHCNQLVVAVTHAATMEMITLARKLGLDPALVTSIVANGIAGSDYFRLLSKSVLNNTPSPGSLGQMCKDVDIVKNTLREYDMRAYVTEAAARYFAVAREQGMSEREGADLIRVVEQMADGEWEIGK